jgi:hypothetical protein
LDLPEQAAVMLFDGFRQPLQGIHTGAIICPEPARVAIRLYHCNGLGHDHAGTAERSILVIIDQPVGCLSARYKARDDSGMRNSVTQPEPTNFE